MMCSAMFFLLKIYNVFSLSSFFGSIARVYHTPLSILIFMLLAVQVPFKACLSPSILILLIFAQPSTVQLTQVKVSL